MEGHSPSQLSLTAPSGRGGQGIGTQALLNKVDKHIAYFSRFSNVEGL